MRFVNALVPIVGVLTPALALAATSAEDSLKGNVVQLRVTMGTERQDQCAVGLLVGPNLILTAAHVVNGARRIRVTAVALDGREHGYEIPKDAEIVTAESMHDPENPSDSRWDLAFIKLGWSWPDWRDEDRPALTPLSPGDLDPTKGFAVSVYAFHHNGQCKAQNAAVAQGFHHVDVTMNDLQYRHPNPTSVRIRVFPPLDRGYSGSPLVLSPCGTRNSCVIGIDSEMTNDASAQSTFVVGFDESPVRRFFTAGAGVKLDAFDDPRVASSGIVLAGGLAVDGRIGSRAPGVAFGVAGRIGFVWGIGRFNEWAVGPDLQMSLQKEQSALHSMILSPDGSQSVDGAEQEVTSAARIEPGLTVEAFRTHLFMLRVTPNWAWSTFGIATGPSDLSANGPGLRVGARYKIGSHLGVEVSVGAHWWRLKYNRSQYTLVPGAVVTESATTREPAVGVQVTATYW